MNVDILEGNASGEEAGHHDHTSHPEEQDVVSGHENGGRQINIKSLRIVDQCGEGHQSRGEPCVEHVFIAMELDAFACFLLGFFFVMSNINIAFVVIPGRNLMAPPKLTRQTPILNIREPVFVNLLPLFGEDVD